MEARDIIIKPVVTEKSVSLDGTQQICFQSSFERK